MAKAVDFSTSSSTGPHPRQNFPGKRGHECDGRAFAAIFGATLIGFGTLFLLDTFQLLDAREVLAYWPLVLIAVGVGTVIRRKQSLLAGSVMVTIGGVLLARSVGLVDIELFSLWPALLIFVGILFVMRPRGVRCVRGGGRGEVQ